MGGFLSPGPRPAVPPPASPPTRDDAEVRRAAMEERRRRSLAAGRESTIVTGAQGAAGEAPVRRKALLGE
jgi:hypothetical protein